jgi:hypothetical protein
VELDSRLHGTLSLVNLNFLKRGFVLNTSGIRYLEREKKYIPCNASCKRSRRMANCTRNVMHWQRNAKLLAIILIQITVSLWFNLLDPNKIISHLWTFLRFCSMHGEGHIFYFWTRGVEQQTDRKSKVIPVTGRGWSYMFPVRYKHHLHIEMQSDSCNRRWRSIGVFPVRYEHHQSVQK